MEKTLSEYRFPTQYVEIVEQFLHRFGVGKQAMYQIVGINNETDMRSEGVINGDILKRMFELCAEYADENKPLSSQLLDQFPVTAHGLLGIVVMTSPTLNYALDAALRFYPLVMPAYSIRKEEIHDQVHLIFEPLVDFGPLSSDLTETVIGAFNSIQSYVAPNHVMLEMQFKHKNAHPLTDYQSFSDIDRLSFEMPANKVILPKSNLNFSITTANKVTMLQFEKELEKQIQRFSMQLSFAKRLAKALSSQLKTGLKITAENAADMMRVSPRTLSRRLAEENTTFNQLAINAKLEFASFLLLNSEKTISQIAHATGFSNESSFSRAFKKEKGCSPSEYRKAP